MKTQNNCTTMLMFWEAWKMVVEEIIREAMAFEIHRLKLITNK
jgi:hypothetical protein